MIAFMHKWLKADRFRMLQVVVVGASRVISTCIT
jgi:hypothetical protein